MNFKLSILIIVALGARNTVAQEAAAVPGEFVVVTKRQSPTTQSLFNTRLSRMGMKVHRKLTTEGHHLLLKSTSKKQLKNLLSELRKFSELEIVEPNYIYYASMGPRNPEPTPTPTPQDPEDAFPGLVPGESRFGELWAMRNKGQADSGGRRGLVGADIDATNAWNLSQGSRNVVVAVVDSGIDYNHPDLKANIWNMPGRPSVHGYNAINDTLDPMDDQTHGTHVAGVIGAVGNNALGVVGVNWKVSLMGIKFLNRSGAGTLSDAIKGIDWARNNGAKIINNSWGGGPFSQALLEAIERTRDDGIVFVAAAGNSTGGHDNDQSPAYPASYKVDNLIAVAATNNVDKLSSFSHYGAQSVHIGAPGENILSTIPNSSYKSMSGTSMATPYVTGAAALLLAHNPQLSAAQIKSRLLKSADPLSSLRGKVSTGGRLNVFKALRASD